LLRLCNRTRGTSQASCFGSKGACRGLAIRAATFVSRFSEFEVKDRMLQRMEEMRAGREGTEGRDSKEAPPLSGREPACLAKWKSNWRLTWCW
jgi:hypothetical protein